MPAYLHCKYNEEKLWKLSDKVIKKFLGVISLGGIISINAQILGLLL